MKKKDLEVVENFRDLVSQKVKVHELRVFGSRARGDAVAESDLDVLIAVLALLQEKQIATSKHSGAISMFDTVSITFNSFQNTSCSISC